MDPKEISAKTAYAIGQEKWLRIKTVAVLHVPGKVHTIEEEIYLFPLVQDDTKIYGFNRDGGSGTSVIKDDITEIEVLP